MPRSIPRLIAQPLTRRTPAVKVAPFLAATDTQGQTPLQVVAAGRATRDRLAQAQAMMQSMGIKLPGFVGQLPNIKLPMEGWDACERLLRAHGAK